MTLENLTDKQIHQNLLTLKSKESHIVADIISHLEEVYRRRFFADYKCSSIYDYCIRILGYSNGEAHRKISACKLASQCQGVKESIAKGELSLSNAASVQMFLNQSKKALEKAKLCSEASAREMSLGIVQMSEETTSKSSVNQGAQASSTLPPQAGLNPKAIIERVKNKSSRECEIELEKIASENQLEVYEKTPSKRNVGDKLLLKVYLDRDKLELLKSRLNLNCEQELLQLLLEEKLNATEPRTNIKPRVRARVSQKPRSIAPAKRALLMRRAHSKCENCGSRHHLQIDHKLSVALGGSNDIGNLRVLCRSCNQRAAIDQLGLATMGPFLTDNSAGG